MGAITSLLVLGVVGLLRPGSGLQAVPVVVAIIAATVSALLGRSMLMTVLIGAAAFALASLLAGPVVQGLLGR
jgi:branched-subunit amino acid transport protein